MTPELVFHPDRSMEHAARIQALLKGLRGSELMARKRGEESALRAFAESSARSNKEYAGAWGSIAKARQALSSYERDRRMLGGATATDYANTGFNTRY